jgi:hypothetical protein
LPLRSFGPVTGDCGRLCGGWRTRNIAFSKTIGVTPLSSSNAWAGFGRAESAFTIAPLALMSKTEFCGSGSAITPNMIASLANLLERYRDLGLINLVEMYR